MFFITKHKRRCSKYQNLKYKIQVLDNPELKIDTTHKSPIQHKKIYIYRCKHSKKLYLNKGNNLKNQGNDFWETEMYVLSYRPEIEENKDKQTRNVYGVTN